MFVPLHGRLHSYIKYAQFNQYTSNNTRSGYYIIEQVSKLYIWQEIIISTEANHCSIYAFQASQCPLNPLYESALSKPDIFSTHRTYKIEGLLGHFFNFMKNFMFTHWLIT